MDFANGSAVSIVSGFSREGLAEGAASVCDRNTGDLLFYTNGHKVWNANHQPMLNGDSLFGNGSAASTRQGALIVPFIEDTNRYYIFSLDNVDATANNKQLFIGANGDTIAGSLFYSVVDMNLDAGLGGIVSGQKNILLDSTALGEGMIAIPGICQSIWLLVHTAGPPLTDNPPMYKAYQITSSGVDVTPVLSPGRVHATRSWLAVSPDRNTIAITGGGANLASTFETGLEIAKFDVESGEVSEPTVLEWYDDTPLIPLGQVSMGCAFSPDGSKLYYDIGNYVDTFYLMQCDVSVFDSAAIVNSKTRIAANPSNNELPEYYSFMPGFRLYNDTLYLSGMFNGDNPPYYISRINNPNAAGGGCDYESRAIGCLPGTSPAGGTLGTEAVFVPSTGTDTVNNRQSVVICEAWPEDIKLTPIQPNGIYYSWSDQSNDSVLVVNRGGTYWVNYYTADCRYFYSDTFHVTEINLPKPVIRVNGMELSTALSYHTYQWLYNGATLAGEIDSVLHVEVNGYYQVVVTNEEGCTDTSAIYEVTNAGSNGVQELLNQQIHVWPNPIKDMVFVQAPISVNLSIITVSGKVIQQKSSANRLSTRNLDAGIYFLRISDRFGKVIRVEKIIKVTK